jgi:hypothetical protein
MPNIATTLSRACATLLCCCLGNIAVYAADECKDVLVNKVMNMADIRQDNYYTMTLLSSLDERRTSDSKTNAELGVTISGIPFSLKNDDATRMSTQLNQTFDLGIIRRERASILLMSGQESIINAWKECMSRRGGLSIRFEPLNGNKGTQTFLHVEYFISGAPSPDIFPPLELSEDVFIDPDAASVQSGSECLHKKRIYNPGNDCTVQLKTKSAWVTMPIIIHTTSPKVNNSYTAYIGPRAIIKGSTIVWPKDGSPFFTPRLYTAEHPAVGPTVCRNSDDPYTFARESLKIIAQPGGAAVDYDSCKTHYDLEPSGKRICINAEIAGVPGLADYYCTVGATATEMTVIWDPPP